MSWFYLLIAALFEVGWPVGLKMAEISAVKAARIIFAVLATAASGLFPYTARKGNPIGAVWTRIGTAVRSPSAFCSFTMPCL